MREEAEAAAKAEAEAAAKAAEEAAKAGMETTEPDITLIDDLPGTNSGYGFGEATAAPTATPVPEATLPARPIRNESKAKTRERAQSGERVFFPSILWKKVG